MAATKVDQFLDQLLMLKFGNQGNKEANLFLEDCARYPITDVNMIWHRRTDQRTDQRMFIPPKQEDRIIMFSDGSGVYVHSDGFCTPMGADIRGECE